MDENFVDLICCWCYFYGNNGFFTLRDREGNYKNPISTCPPSSSVAKKLCLEIWRKLGQLLLCLMASFKWQVNTYQYLFMIVQVEMVLIKSYSLWRVDRGMHLIPTDSTPPTPSHLICWSSWILQLLYDFVMIFTNGMRSPSTLWFPRPKQYTIIWYKFSH